MKKIIVLSLITAIFSSCAPVEENPDIRPYLDMISETNTFSDVYEILAPHLNIRDENFKKNESVPGNIFRYSDIQEFKRTISAKKKGSIWTYEAIFYFAEDNSFIGAEYTWSGPMICSEIKAWYWTPKWFKERR